MKNALNIISSVVLIAAICFVVYLNNQANLRKKEIDKKISDSIDEQKEINKIIKKKLLNNEISLNIKLNDSDITLNGKAKKKDAKKIVKDVAEHNKN